MNKIYALVWNPVLDCWNVVSENCCRRGKGSNKRRLATALSLLGLVAFDPAYALPVGQNIVAGSGDITASGQQMTINQHSDKLITQWDGFSVGSGESVTFNQPGRGSVALNRVMGVNGSDIQGKIDANGKVFLVNPNGVVFGKNAQVNVGGLVASTRDISNADFLAGKNRFVGKSQAEVRNDGTLTASEAGSVALLGARVSNQGVISAQMGSIALAAGDDVTLNFDGNNLLNLQVDGAALNALAQNGGLLKADGGQVLMTAKAAGDVLQNVVNNQGKIEATTLQDLAGRIVLDGGSVGTVNVAGTLDAGAPLAGNGGRIDTRGANVVVQPEALVSTHAANGKTGEWALSTANLQVTSASTDKGTLSAASLANNLSRNNVALNSTQGDLAVSGPVAWNSGNKLSLTAKRGGIAINAPITATGVDAGLTLNQKNGYSLNNGAAVTLSGKNATFSANGENYLVIHDLSQLEGIADNAQGHYVLGNNITSYSKIKPIAADTGFGGVLDGLGNTVKGLTVAGNDVFMGLFGSLDGRVSNLNLDSLSVNGGSNGAFTGGLAGINLGEISNVNMSNIRVNGAGAVGGLVGLNLGDISHAAVSGSVKGSGADAVGGLIGWNQRSLNNVKASGEVTAMNSTDVGGLVGRNDDGSISNAQVDSKVTGGNGAYIGGLVGRNNNGVLTDVQAQGAVTGGGSSHIGGLLGYNAMGKVSNAVAGSKVSGGRKSYVGGLIGTNGGVLAGVNATGDVTATYGTYVGGLVGLQNGASITYAGASGDVNGTASEAIGGLVGYALDSQLSNVEAQGNVTDLTGANLGGLVGVNRDTHLQGAKAANNVIGGNNANIGGLIGDNVNGQIANAQASGKTEGRNGSNIGGLIGHNNGALSDISASGEVFAGDNGRAGGLVGYNAGAQLLNAGYAGSVTAGKNSKVGGLIGENQKGSVRKAQVDVNLKSGSSSYGGGAVGYNDGSLTQVSVQGNVAGGADSNLGGVAGLHSYVSAGKIEQAVSAANVSGGNNSNVGGLVGQNSATILSSVASGQIRGGSGSLLGGLAAFNGGLIANSQFSGSLPSAAQYRIGSLAGVNLGRLKGNKVSGSAEQQPLVWLNHRPGTIE